MKKISIIALVACALFASSCENDSTLEETRVAEVTAPTVSFEVSVNKYDATFNLTSTAGNPEAIETGIMVSTESQPTINNSTVLAADESGTITETFNPGTTYYACAYALTSNKLVTSEVKTFTTDSHPLGAFLGKKTLGGLNLFAGAEDAINVTITPDPADESVAYLSGLGSEQVALPLGSIKLVFDLGNNTVTIPNGQIIEEANYGAYRYVMLDEETNPLAGHNVGTIENGVINFNSLAAMIVEGGNAGLFHWAFFYISIQ
ncbi:MAG: hypothetical protein E7099_06975 [Mediterranea massiliensis]|nr:hypothetical protein [Mediterranea massiliensis]